MGEKGYVRKDREERKVIEKWVKAEKRGKLG